MGIKLVRENPKSEKVVTPLGTRGVATGIYQYIYEKIYPQNQLSGCSSPMTQDRFDMIHVNVWDINIVLKLQ